MVYKLNAQPYVLIKNIPSQATNIQVDKFDILYIVEDYKISQYNTKGELLYSYENMNQGEISKLDVSNPFKPVVLYEDHNVVCVLDNKLALISTISLNQLNQNAIAAISAPNTTQFWVYDNIDNALKLYDKNFVLENQSENFIQLFGAVSEIKSLKIANKKIYLLDQESIKVFDQFGSYIKSYSVGNIVDFQIFKQQLVFFEDGALQSINELSLETKVLALATIPKHLKNVLLLKNHLFYRYKENCSIYSINN